VSVDHDGVTEVEGTAVEVTETAGKVDGQDAKDTQDADAAARDEAPVEVKAEAPDPVSGEAPPPRRGLLRRWLVPIVLTVLLLGSAGLASWAYLVQLRPDQQTNDAVAAQAIKAASEGTVALLSYSPDTLDKDFAAAKGHLTGDFLTYYTQFTQDIVSPAAKQKQVKTSAAVVKAAVSELTPDSAVVLVFLNQTTTSKDNPDGSFSGSAVKVGLTKVNGTWLISKFDPV
jgi:Mce-associated membrane protein